MVGIDPSLICHCLNIDQKYTPVRQKGQPLDKVWYAASQEVEKLSKNEFIREIQYPKWIMKKSNNKWRTYIDFTDLNKLARKIVFLCQE